MSFLKLYRFLALPVLEIGIDQCGMGFLLEYLRLWFRVVKEINVSRHALEKKGNSLVPDP
jgi:hypothetical protein